MSLLQCLIIAGEWFESAGTCHHFDKKPGKIGVFGSSARTSVFIRQAKERPIARSSAIHQMFSSGARGEWWWWWGGAEPQQ